MPDGEDDEAIAAQPTELSGDTRRGETKQMSHPSVVPPNNQAHAEKPYHVLSIMKEHSGPLPPAEYFREINAVIPDGAERVLAMAEKQAAHRQSLEWKDLDAAIDHDKGEISRSNRGLAAGFITALSFLGAVYLIHGGHDTAGTIIGSVDIVGLVSVFVIGRVYSGKPSGDDTAPSQPPGKTFSEGESKTRPQAD